MEKREVIQVTGLPIVAGFRWSVGKMMEKFIKSFADKKILAAKCPKCGYTYVPPRSRCGKCYTKIEEKNMIELSGKGTLIGHTTAHVQLDGKGNFLDLDKPKVIGAIKLEDSDSTIFMPLGEIDPKNVKEGIKVKVMWKEETKGEIADILYFKPAR